MNGDHSKENAASGQRAFDPYANSTRNSGVMEKRPLSRTA